MAKNGELWNDIYDVVDAICDQLGEDGTGHGEIYWRPKNSKTGNA